LSRADEQLKEYGGPFPDGNEGSRPGGWELVDELDKKPFGVHETGPGGDDSADIFGR
jgi:hypothetical protein